MYLLSYQDPPHLRRSTQFLCKRERPPPGEPEKKTTFRSFLLRRRPGATSGERRLLKKRGVNFSRNYFRPLPFTPLPPIFFFLKKILRFHPLHFRRETAGRGRRTFKRETPPFPKQEYTLFQWSATGLKKLYGLDCPKSFCWQMELFGHRNLARIFN